MAARSSTRFLAASGWWRGPLSRPAQESRWCDDHGRKNGVYTWSVPWKRTLDRFKIVDSRSSTKIERTKCLCLIVGWIIFSQLFALERSWHHVNGMLPRDLIIPIESRRRTFCNVRSERGGGKVEGWTETVNGFSDSAGQSFTVRDEIRKNRESEKPRWNKTLP